ncbi:uncharacterized protein [Gossypium hirsutum]|uniref:G-patch domain-containing protein n=1 Tax=Gossypium hirsutum TaxID=3635 RepID=A0ABM2YVN7_GOSHI|nr:uncharacterized protein LOC121208118 [Gossypium hirsutum]
MIENAVRGGKIEGEVAKKSAPRKKNNEVNNMNSLNSRAVTIAQPKTEQQSTQRQESGTRQNSERIQFTPIPVTYRELYQSLYDAHAIAPFHLKLLQPPYPKWYDVNAKCEYHVGIPGHSIENCTGFKKAVEKLIKMGVVKFDSTPSTENPLPDHGNQEVNAIDEIREGKIKEDIAEVKTPMKVIWEMVKRGNNEVEAQTGPRVVIHKPNPFPYKDDKRVPWSYDCSVTVLEGESIASASRGVQNEGSHTRSGKRYDTRAVRVEPTKEKSVEVEKEKEIGIPINEPLRKQPVCISELALFLSSEVRRDALLKVLNETYATHDISINKLDRLVNNISADNFIYFNDDKIPLGGIGSTKALHITTRCKGYTLPSALVDNGSALNEEAKEFLKFLKHSEYSVVEQLRKQPVRISVLALLLSSKVHRDALLQLVTDGRLITINAEEDIIAAVTSKAPYVEANEEAIECSFHSLEIINATFIFEESEVPVPKMSRARRMALKMMMGKGALPGKGLGRQLQGGIQIPKLIEKKDRFGLGFRLDHKHKRQEIEKRQARRKARLNGGEVKWEPMTFPPISKSFKLGGLLVEESHQINAIHDEGLEQGNLEEEPQDFEDVQDYDVSLDLLRMVK